MEFVQGTKKRQLVGSHNSRPTIGLLIGRLGDQRSQTLVWPGIADVAEERDANLICFVGSALRSPYGLDAQRNIVYDLADQVNVDGLVALSGTLGHHIGPEQLKRFYERYRPLPIVGTSIPLEGIPTVLVDNESGMRAAVGHLIEVHSRRRIAFIRGPAGHPEADQRYQAYVRVLKEHDLPLDSALVAPGDFVYTSGVDAINLLLDQRKIDFDAVVVSNDETALGVLNTLQERGIVVPQDVAVVGFDDVEEARYSIPPLTTTKQPLYQQGRCAAETLLALLAGESVPEQITLPSKLMIRESCGCYHQRVVEAGAGPVKWSGETFKVSLHVQKGKIIQDLLDEGRFNRGGSKMGEKSS